MRIGSAAVGLCSGRTSRQCRRQRHVTPSRHRAPDRPRKTWPGGETAIDVITRTGTWSECRARPTGSSGGQPVPGAPYSLTHAIGPADPIWSIERTYLDVPARRWAAVPAENFLAWNTLRRTEFAILVLRMHNPDSTALARVLRRCSPGLRIPDLRCTGCTGSMPSPCQLVAWTHDWIRKPPGIVAAPEPRAHVVDGVSEPVVVGDVQVPAVTWDTSSTGWEVACAV